MCCLPGTVGGAPIVATAGNGDEATVLAAFSAGADQSTPLTTSPRQFVARLRSLLRRHPPAASGGPAPALGPVVLDVARRPSTMVHGEVVTLSDQEYHVLSALMDRAGRVVSRKDLLGDVSTARTDRALDFVIRRLRQKLEQTDTRRRITAVRGVGFPSRSTPPRDGSRRDGECRLTSRFRSPPVQWHDRGCP